MVALIRCLPLALLLACAPRSADRGLDRADAASTGGRPSIDPPTTPAPAPFDAAVPADTAATPAPTDGPSAPARPDTRPADTGGPDAPVDRGSDADELRVADAAADRKVADEVAPVATALLVVGDPAALTLGDRRLGGILNAINLRVRVAADLDPVNVTGIRVVVLAASCMSANLGARYRDIAVPIVSTEPAVLDDLGMTGPVEGIDWEETEGTFITIALPQHQMAAGLSGAVTVTNQLATLTWGRPTASAEQVATFADQPDRAAIFGYQKMAAMVTGPAPARRVGFFAADGAAADLTSAGVQLFAAAVLWSLR